MDTILEIVSNTIVNHDTKQRPKVCLTWAQSLDGRLSRTPNAPTVISGSHSMQMTHALRALHQTILVGIGTLISDDPRLTCRMDPATREVVDRVRAASEADPTSNSAKPGTSYDPIPVILDSNLRTPSGARCLQAKSGSHSSGPFLFHHSCISRRVKHDPLPQVVQVVQVPLAENSKSSHPCLDLRAVLYELRQRGIRNVMVEGGASVISSFLDRDLWDIVVVTVSAQLFRSGVTLHTVETEIGPNLTQFRNCKWVQLGKDIIFIGFSSSPVTEKTAASAFVP